MCIILTFFAIEPAKRFRNDNFFLTILTMFSVHYESIFSLGGSTQWTKSRKQNTEIADIMRCSNMFSYQLKCVFSMNFSTWVKNDPLWAF